MNTQELPIGYIQDSSQIHNHELYSGLEESLENSNELEGLNEFYGYTNSILMQIAEKRGEIQLYDIYIKDESISDQFEQECFKIFTDVREQLLECRDTANIFLTKGTSRKVPNNSVFKFLGITPTDIGTFIEDDVCEIIRGACNNICQVTHATLDRCSSI